MKVVNIKINKKLCFQHMLFISDMVLKGINSNVNENFDLLLFSRKDIFNPSYVS